VLNRTTRALESMKSPAGVQNGAQSAEAPVGAKVLPPGSVLISMPSKEGGRHTAPGNAAFDARRRRTIPIGACAIWEVAELGRRHGLVL
jgi:hypothetical protein